MEKSIANAGNDADSLEPYYARDVVYYNLSLPTELHGWKAVHDSFASQFSQVRNAHVDILSMSIETAGRFAYAYSTQHFSCDLAEGGAHMDIVFRDTDILKKVRGRWRIVHQHLSVPYDPATGKAVLSPMAGH